MSNMTRNAFLATLAVALSILAASADIGPTHSQGDEPSVRAEAYLRANAGRLGLRPDLQDLRLVAVRRGLSSEHVRYQQTLGGLPVFGRYLTVGLPKDHQSRSQPLVTSRYRPRPVVSASGPTLPLPRALAVVRKSIALSPGNLRGPITTDLVYYPVGEGKRTKYVLAWQVVAPTLKPLGSWLFVLRADSGELLLQQNLLALDSGRVFNPNPARSSGGAIPPPNDCDSPANESTLSTQYQSHTLLGITAGQNRLIGQFVDLSAPGISGAYKPAAVANEPSRNYVYGCNDDRFEEVMVYDHIDAVQRKIQSLGFSGASGILDGPIPAHAHYFSDCNAFFDPTDLGLHFGDGDLCSPSTDAAEDADVIVHEYGHAIQNDQVPGWGFGSLSAVRQALAMGEGFGDFLPAAISGDPCLAEWFNIGVVACGSHGLRTLENSAFFNGAIVLSLPSWCSSSSDPHCAGLVWGGALWDLVQALGESQAARDTILTLVLDSQFYLDPQSTFAEAAAAIRQSDTLLYGGAHVAIIDSVFSARGIASAGAVSDFPYAYMRIIHPYRGDLDVQLQVGPNVAAPLCTVNVLDPDIKDSGDNLIAFFSLAGSPCAAFLPPSPGTPWHLEVRDAFAADTGTIEQFEIALSGASRCTATDLPVAIPDNDGFVYSTIDCSTMISPPGDNDGDTIPDISDPDDDNDGFSDTEELFIGTDHLDACANTATANDEADDRWPPDFNDDRQANILDVIQMTPPVFGSDSTEPNYSARKDLNPDGAVNILDIVRMTAPVFNSGCS